MNASGSNRPSSTAIEMRRIEERYRTFRTLIRAAVVGVALYVAGQAVEKLAGQNTDIAISVVLEVLARFEMVAAFTLAGGTTAWALVERFLRRRKTEYMQGRIRELEELVDSRRTTSGLTPKGKTNPKDIRR
jgi:hypothetical protein